MKKYIFLLLMLCIAASAQELGARYLIITHDNFYNAIQPLAQWKHRKGMRTKVVKLSEIGSSTNQIKDYVEDAYDTWQTPPEFLLLVGAPNYLPFYYYGGGWNSYYSDNYYTNMNYDVYNEILSGRLTVHSSTEAQTVVNKILQYEMAPDISDSLWFINACLIVREDYDWYDDSIYWSDINHAKNLMRNHGYDTIDTLSRTGGDNANDVIQSVNSGRAFVLYRGSGVNNWYSPFNVNPDQAQNSTKLPIVLSITCRTIGTSSSPATAERWLLTGTPSLPSGAAGYFATTTTIMGGSHLRSAVCKGFFNALFQDGKQTFGEACESGRRNVYNNYNSSSEYRGFTTLGDPEMNIWTAIPKPLDVFHDSLLSTDDDSLVVRVEFQSVPFESALVCVVHDTLVYEYGYTASNGEIGFSFESLGPGYMHVTVTAHNKIPYLDSIPVVSTYVEETKELTTTDTYNITVHPNPFTHFTDIRYQISDIRQENIGGSEGGVSEYQKTELKIYDAAGRVVKSFRVTADALRSTLSWDGRDDHNRILGSGVYFLRFSFAREECSIPIVLLQ